MDATTFIVRIYPGTARAPRLVGVVELVPGGVSHRFTGFDELRDILLCTLRAAYPSAGRAPGRRPARKR